MAIHLVPPEVADQTYKRASPRYMNVYKKSLSPIYTFTLETLNGLAIASDVKCPISPDELNDPKEYYDSYTELLKDAEINKTLPIDKPIRFTGKIDDIEYDSKITTYGRLRLSKIIGADIDYIQDTDGKPILPFPNRIDAKASSKLALYLYQLPDGIEKFKKLQEYALKAVTKAGVLTFDFKTLWINTDTETYKKMCEIADSDKLSDKQKLLLLTDLHAKYQKELEDSVSSELKDELKKSNKVKMPVVIDMIAPAFVISGVDQKPMLLRRSLVEGMSPRDFQVHAVENRSLQSIKNSGVPSSGLSVRCPL